MSGGSFRDDRGLEYSWELIEVHTNSGDVLYGSDAEENLRECDRAFYSLETLHDTYYRWAAGPFEDMSDLEDAIYDEADFYAST